MFFKLGKKEKRSQKTVWRKEGRKLQLNKNHTKVCVSFGEKIFSLIIDNSCLFPFRRKKSLRFFPFPFFLGRFVAWWLLQDQNNSHIMCTVYIHRTRVPSIVWSVCARILSESTNEMERKLLKLSQRPRRYFMQQWRQEQSWAWTRFDCEEYWTLMQI